jgi:hypothetical protein
MHLQDDGSQTITRSTVPPLVTLRQRLGMTTAPNVFVAQDRLLGTQVYEVPKYRGSTSVTGGDVKLVGHCTPGSTAYLHLPRVSGKARLTDGDTWMDLTATRRPGINTSGAMVRLGKVPASGVVSTEIKFTADPRTVEAKGVIGCLDEQRLANAIGQLQASAPTAIDVGGHSISAKLAAGSTGYAVVAVPKLPGWQCSVGGGKAVTPRDYGGLLAVQLTGSADRFSCTYTPPGLLRGLAIGGVAALVTLGMVLLGRLRRARS